MITATMYNHNYKKVNCNTMFGNFTVKGVDPLQARTELLDWIAWQMWWRCYP